MATRNLIIRIIGDESSLTRAFRNSTAQASRFEATMERTLGAGAAAKARRFNGVAASVRGNAFLGGLTGGAAAFGAAEAAQKLRESVGLAADLGEAQSKNVQLFGESARAIDRWAETTASGIGVARGAAIAAAGDFGGLFRTIGLGEAQASGMSRRLVELAADLASFNNTSIEDAIAALRSGLAGESEPLRRYQVLLSEARVKQQAYSDGIAESGAALTEAQKVQARFNLILRDSVQAQGDFARTSGQLANQSRILNAQLTDLQTNLGLLATPYLTDVVGTANDTIAGLQALGSELDGLSSQVERLTGRDIDLGIGEAAKDIARLTFESNQLTRPLADAVRILMEMGQAGKVFADMTDEANAFRAAISLKGLKGQTVFDLTLPDFTTKKGGPTAPFKGAPFDVQGGLDVFRKIGENVRSALDGVNTDIDLAQRRIDEANLRAEKQRQGFEDLMDRLSLRVDIASATGNLEAQVAGLRQQEKALLEQVRIEGHTVELDRRLFELRQDRQRLLADSRAADQFKALGLNADGTARVPGVESLRRQLGTIADKITGTPLDTTKTRAELSRIAKVLRGDYGKVGDDVASSIQGMYDKINDALKDSKLDTGTLTKTTALSPSILKGLNLPAAEERILRARFSHFNSAGVARAGAGIGGTLSGNVTVDNHVTVQVDGQKVEATVTKQQQKRRRRNPPPRTGPGAGVSIA